MKARLFLLFLVVFCALMPAAPPAGEAQTILATARVLSAAGALDLADAPGSGRLPSTVVYQGRRRALTPLLPALALVPAAALARAAASVDRGGLIATAAATLTSALVVAVLGLAFFSALVRQRLAAGPALGFTLVLALATPLLFYARVPDGTALATLFVWLAVSSARRGRAVELGLALGAMVLSDPTLILPALAILVWCALRPEIERTSLWPVLVPLALATALVFAHHRAIGGPAAATAPMLQGLDGLLLSTGKSLFLYAPILLLAPVALLWRWRTERSRAILVLAVSGALLFAVGRLADWHGDPAWGPRRIVPLVPLLVEVVALYWLARADAARPRVTALVAVLAVIGFGVQMLGVALAPAFYLSVVTEVRANSGSPSWYALEPSECHFIPQLSPIVGHAWLLSHLVRDDPRLEINPPYKLLLANPPKLDASWKKLDHDFAWLRALRARGGP